MVNLPTQIPDCKSHNHILLDLFVSFEASVCSTIVFLQLRNSDHDVVWVPINIPSNPKQNASFHHVVYDYSHADCDHLCDHLREVPWVDIIKFSASAAASLFGEWVQVGIDV